MRFALQMLNPKSVLFKEEILDNVLYELMDWAILR